MDDLWIPEEDRAEPITVDRSESGSGKKEEGKNCVKNHIYC